MYFKQKTNVYRLVVCAMMVALSVILGSYFSLSLLGDVIRISFFMVPVLLIAILYGPVYGGMAGFVAEILKSLLAGRGFSFAFPFTAFIGGFLMGLFFIQQKPVQFWHIFLATFVSQSVQSLLLNSALLYFLYRYPLVTLFPRIAITGINIIVYPILIQTCLLVLQRTGLLKRRTRQ